MIFLDEVQQCMDGSINDDEIGLAVEYFRLGGFHPRVLEPERRAFICRPTVYRTPTTEEQLNFFDDLEASL